MICFVEESPDGLEDIHGKLGDFVYCEEEDALWVVARDWSKTGEDLKLEKVYFDGASVNNFVKDLLYHHGMKENGAGSYMLDTGSIVKQLCEINQGLKESLKGFQESNNDLVMGFHRLIKEHHSLRGQIQNHSILEE